VTWDRRRRQVLAWTRIAVVATFALVTVGVPLLLLVLNSFKPGAEAVRLTLALPQKWRAVENYSRVIEDGEVARGLINTLLVVIPSIAIILVLGSLAAWVFARSNSKLMTSIYYVSIAALLIPGAVIATIVVLKALGIYGGLVGLIAIYVGGGLSYAIFLMTGFMKTVPLELEEAARIDGASSFTVYWWIVVPLLRPVMTTYFIIQLLALWNDFFWPLFALQSSKSATLTLGWYSFANSAAFTTRWELVFAYVVVVSLPLLLVFAFAQRRIVEGVMAGSRK
jgi:raffinose/stachyose/melibiose transport system permease protein